MSKKKKSGLSSRYQKSYDSKDAGGANTDIMNWGQVEGEVQFYKAKEGMNKLIIVPYIIKSKNHPLVHSGDMEIGNMDYVMDLYVHRRIGPTEKDAICLRLNYGKACPICDAAKEYRQKGEDEAYRALKASRRVYYNVLNARKVDNGLMVFNGVSHWLFEKEMIEEARGGSEDGEIIDFASVEKGKVVKFRGNMDNIGSNEFLKFKSFDFLEREEELDDGIEKETISFDEILILRDAKELEKLLYDEDEEESEKEEKEEKEESGRSRHKKQDSEKSDSGKEKKTCPEGYTFGKDFDEDDDCEDCNVRKECKKAGKGKKEQREMKKEEKQEKEKKTPCPHGHTFGEDCDDYGECDDCESWEECSEEG